MNVYIFEVVFKRMVFWGMERKVYTGCLQCKAKILEII
jgi:hypothetical protein